MKLNADISRLFQKKETVYPTKRSMNLYFKEDRTTAPATAALYILFAVVVLLALSKVMIYDLWNEAARLEDQSAQMQAQAAAQLEQLQSYNTVLEDYVRSTLTQTEQSHVDSMEILNLIDSTIRPSADISDVAIEGNKVVLTFSGVTLQQAGALVTRLEQSDLVTNTSIDTAESIQQNQNLVEIHVYFEVAQEEDTQP